MAKEPDEVLDPEPANATMNNVVSFLAGYFAGLEVPQPNGGYQTPRKSEK